MSVNHPPDLTSLCDAFEDDVWVLSADQLQEDQPKWLIRLREGNLRIEFVLREQSDETLVICVQKDFFATEAFTELLPGRYEKRLHQWFRRWSKDRELVFDLTQRVLMNLWRNRFRRFDPYYSRVRDTLNEEINNGKII